MDSNPHKSASLPAADRSTPANLTALDPSGRSTDHDALTSQSPPGACQLCGEEQLNYFPIGSKNQFWLCSACQLYQYGQLVDVQAYEWDYHAPYVRHQHRKSRTAAYRLGRVAAVLESRKPSILEIGCSIGSTLQAASRLGWDATGLDVDESVVQACKARGLNAMTYDGTRIPFDEATFDAIVSWHVIEHVPDVRATFADWFRVLRPGGVVVLETPDANCPKVRRRGASYEKFWAAEHTYTFTESNLGKFAAQAGFEILTAPQLGSVHRLPFSDAAYSVAYHVQSLLRKWSGLEKAFQLFARKPG